MTTSDARSSPDLPGGKVHDDDVLVNLGGARMWVSRQLGEAMSRQMGGEAGWLPASAPAGQANPFRLPVRSSPDDDVLLAAVLRRLLTTDLDGSGYAALPNETSATLVVDAEVTVTQAEADALRGVERTDPPPVATLDIGQLLTAEQWSTLVEAGVLVAPPRPTPANEPRLLGRPD